jgi:hypothetical protein
MPFPPSLSIAVTLSPSTLGTSPSMNADAAQALLTVKVQSVGPENIAQRPLELRAVMNDTWSESGINWTNQPSLGPVLQTFHISSADVGTEIAIDVTSFVNQERTADGIASFSLMQPDGGNALVSFHSSESSNPPRLEINHPSWTLHVTQNPNPSY